ncbi:hypothetical protein [Streptomyces lonarensis]|uniref:Lipoprotein n=1 Tax=Streptomyces lonarensis TaxID=700599 RepID=A0A7X6D0D7_9ACTN|nr:hypothetical protein [Streptomyces lonarensis]NJQ05842.1 hypothetical protein [Streptomyces lonarensis]
MFRTRSLGVAAATLAVLAVTACGSGDSDGSEAGGKGGSVDAGENDTDGSEADDDADDDGDGDDAEQVDAGETDDDADEGEDSVGELPDSYDFTPDPDRVPQDAERARELTTNAQLTPETWQDGMVAGEPFATAGTFTVLGDDCVWDRGELPDTVLDSLTHRINIPAADGKGLVQTAVTVTVHTSDDAAVAEMDAVVQESFRCPDQELGGGQRLSGLLSMPMPEEDVLNADSSMFEAGQFSTDADPTAHDFVWSKSRIGPVTAAVSVKGAEGYDVVELLQVAAEGAAWVLYNIELELS